MGREFCSVILNFMYKGFTLVELITVLVIIGIIVAFVAPQFAVTKERALDREAKATLALIQAAENIYKMELNSYYPSPAGTISNDTAANTDLINANLKLSLPVAGASSAWNYSVNSNAPGQATATRNKAGGRTFSNLFTSDAISCTPNGDICPP